MDRAAIPVFEKEGQTKKEALKEVWEKSPRTLAGLNRYIKFDKLYDFFKQGLNSEQELTEEQLKEFNLKKGSKKQQELINETRKVIKEMEKSGQIVKTRHGKVVVDIGRELRAGYHAARAYGYDGYLLYNPKTESYFLVVDDADLSDLDLSEGVNAKKNMSRGRYL